MNDLIFHNPEGVGTHFHVYLLCQRHCARCRVHSCDSTEDGGSHGTHGEIAHFYKCIQGRTRLSGDKIIGVI